MSDSSSQFELDDELLSAYIDDELSADQRAAVEARLAADPAAQHLLEQLRSVLQSVQALPLESVGCDLSETIVRAAVAAKQGNDKFAAARSSSTGSLPTGGGEAMPTVSVFRTPRSWFWASMAVAAALLMMVMQSGDDPNQGLPLPTVAQRDGGQLANQPREEAAQRAIDATAPAAPVDAPAASPPLDSIAMDRRSSEISPASESDSFAFQTQNELQKKLAVGAKAEAPLAAASRTLEKQNGELNFKRGASVATGAAGQSSIDTLAATTPNAGPEGNVSESLSDDAGMRADLAQGENPRYVVHVLAKRAALENKTFDELLRRNGIVVEAQPDADKQSNTDVKLFSGTSELKRATDVAEKKPMVGSQAVEAVLVEAPRPAILACVSGLNQDASNFTGLSIEESPTATAAKEKVAAAPNQEAARDLTRYNRGNVPQQQKDLYRNSRYFDFATPGERAESALAYGGFRGAADDAKMQAAAKTAPAAAEPPNKEALGRARRIELPELEGRGRAGETADVVAGRESVSDESLKKDQVRQKTRAPAAAPGDSDNLQVLFLLCPDEEAATSAPAEKSAQ